MVIHLDGRDYEKAEDLHWLFLVKIHFLFGCRTLCVKMHIFVAISRMKIASRFLLLW